MGTHDRRAVEGPDRAASRHARAVVTAIALTDNERPIVGPELVTLLWEGFDRLDPNLVTRAMLDTTLECRRRASDLLGGEADRDLLTLVRSNVEEGRKGDLWVDTVVEALQMVGSLGELDVAKLSELCERITRGPGGYAWYVLGASCIALSKSVELDGLVSSEEFLASVFLGQELSIEAEPP